MLKYLFAAALIPLGGCFLTTGNVLPNVGVKADLQSGIYRCIPANGQPYSIGIAWLQIGDRYQYVTAGGGGVAFYALHPVAGTTYLATHQGDKGPTAANVAILRVHADSIEYVLPPRSLVESLAPRHGVRVEAKESYYTLTGSAYDQLALMRDVATQLRFDGANTRCARVYS